MHPEVERITECIRARSRATRREYLDMLERSAEHYPPVRSLSCSNLAHAVAASDAAEKRAIAGGQGPNIGIVTAYNDMLSAHQPLATYPAQIKLAARQLGASAQVAGGVPAMCDGVTQGQPGMELSLFSRDVVAMATAIALSHNVFDCALLLGVCDKIVPGLLIGALQFGHLPAVFVPAGPMPSGISNAEKAQVRERFAAGEIGQDELFEAESGAYHSAGTCTFYGTANSNQLLMELLGVQLASASFVNPGTELRTRLTREAVRRVVSMSRQFDYRPLSEVVTEATLVNAMVGLLASGGSTNHTLHIVAMAQAAGIVVTWEDFAALSRAVPTLARVYPNGSADVNRFRNAGGIAYLVYELRRAGLLNEDVVTVMGAGLDAYQREAELGDDGGVRWSAPLTRSRDDTVLRPVRQPFDPEGGIQLIRGNLGEAVVKTSAVAEAHRHIRAPCRVFDSQAAFRDAFDAGQLNRDVVVVVRFQGPRANGMPEMHKLTPYLGVLQDRGHRVALVTDGRMSGASGKVLAAIHVTPEAHEGGALARLCDGDILEIDPERGVLCADLGEGLGKDLGEDALRARPAASPPVAEATIGRGLFARLRGLVDGAAAGAGIT